MKMLRVLYIDTNPLSDIWLANIFSQCVVKLFVFLTVAFERQQIHFGDSFLLTQFVYVFHVILKKSLPNPRPVRLSPVIFAFKFYSLNLKFKSMVHFKLVFVSHIYIWGKGWALFYWIWLSKCFSTVCWKDHPLPI
jgi:hypothetical protein